MLALRNYQPTVLLLAAITASPLLLAVSLAVLAASPALAQPPPDEHRWGRGEGHRMERGRRWGTDTVTAEEEQQAKEILARLDPDRLERLLAIKTVSPRRYNMYMRKALWLGHRLRASEGDTAAWRRIQRMFGLESEVAELSGRYRESISDQEKVTIRAELVEKLSALFDLREDEKREEMKRLERRLAELGRIIEERSQNKDAIVERRAQGLTGGRGALEW
jgi:hypothetical protein